MHMYTVYIAETLSVDVALNINVDSHSPSMKFPKERARAELSMDPSFGPHQASSVEVGGLKNWGGGGGGPLW